jgi:anti-sigma B factor antagonist
MSVSDRPIDAVATAEHDRLVVSIVGELDMAREFELLNLVTALDPVSAATVDVDLSEVDFVDSKGLDSILRTKTYLDLRGRQLRLVRPQKHFLRLLELAGLADVFTVVDDRTTSDEG